MYQVTIFDRQYADSDRTIPAETFDDAVSAVYRELGPQNNCRVETSVDGKSFGLTIWAADSDLVLASIYDVMPAEPHEDSQIRARIIDACDALANGDSGPIVALFSYSDDASLPHVDMIEVPGTSHDADVPPCVAQLQAFLAPRTAPVFVAAEDSPQLPFEHVVAVTYRNEAGQPVHGGLFAVGPEGVASITLKDLEGKVDTSRDPSFVAFGLLMMRGPLVFRHDGVDQEMDVSIVDISAAHPESERDLDSTREVVRTAYLKHVLPKANLLAA